MKKLWSESLEILKTKISEQNISTWIRPIHPVKLTGNMLTIEVPNKFIKDWIKDNYKTIIEETLSQIGMVNYTLIIKTNKKRAVEVVKEAPFVNVEIKKETIKVENFPNINPKYTFDTFVSGTSNQFAHAAAMAVSKNPATTYNPLFIYGGVGLGKTHLINAIGNEIYKNNKSIKICYYSSERFTNELINSLRHAKMNEFRNKFS